MKNLHDNIVNTSDSDLVYSLTLDKTKIPEHIVIGSFAVENDDFDVCRISLNSIPEGFYEIKIEFDKEKQTSGENQKKHLFSATYFVVLKAAYIGIDTKVATIPLGAVYDHGRHRCYGDICSLENGGLIVSIICEAILTEQEMKVILDSLFVV